MITEGVTPSLHIDYKRSRIKQYYKEDRALRTETTINDPRDFDIGKRLSNLPALRRLGFQANRRLLDVQRISQDCALGEDAFHGVNDPVEVDGQRASGLRFADEAVQALFSALLVFRLLPRGFSNRDLRDHWAALLGKGPRRHNPRPDDLSPAATSPARPDRADPRDSPLSGDQAGLADRAILHSHLQPNLTTRPRPDHSDRGSGRLQMRQGFDQIDQVIDRWIEKRKVPA